MRALDFLDVDRYPTITFKRTAIRGTKEHFQVTGDLTIRDIRKPITLDVELVQRGRIRGVGRARPSRRTGSSIVAIMG